MAVTYFHRKRRPNANYSIEAVFDEIRRSLTERIISHIHIAPCLSNGLWQRMRIAADARRHQGHINHVTGDINFATILLDPARTILTNHDCGFLARTSGLRRWLLKLFWLDLPVWRSRVVTTVSHEAKRDLVAHTGCDPNKVVVIHNPASPRFSSSPKPFNDLKPRFLQIGTAANKNLPRTIKALAGLNCTLVIVGRLSPDLVAQLTTEGITYENYFDIPEQEILRQYQLCDGVLFASTLEGFGLPILEANSVGRPVITSNISSMPEVAGKAACFVDPFDVQSIKSGIIKMWHDAGYRDSLIQHGFGNVARFHPDYIAQQYYDLYSSVSSKLRTDGAAAAVD